VDLTLAPPKRRAAAEKAGSRRGPKSDLLENQTPAMAGSRRPGEAQSALAYTLKLKE
jgi:hypothetical protein